MTPTPAHWLWRATAALCAFGVSWLAPVAARATEGGRAGGYSIPPCEDCGEFPMWAQTLLTVVGVLLAFALMYAVIKLVDRLRARRNNRRPAEAEQAHAPVKSSDV